MHRQRRGGDRAGRPLHRRDARRDAAGPVTIAVNKMDRLSRPSARRRRCSTRRRSPPTRAEVFPISARTGERHRGARRAPRRAASREPVPLRARAALRPVPRGAARRADPRAGAPADLPGAAARRRRRDRRARAARRRADRGSTRSIWVETESQKAIVIGHGGRMIKAIGTAARRELERELGDARPPRPPGARPPPLARRRQPARPPRHRVALLRQFPDGRRDRLRRARPRAVRRAGLVERRGADARVHERARAGAHARDRRAAPLEPLARRALAQGRDVRQHAGGARAAARLRRRRAARARRAGRPGLPHRRADVLPPRRARAAGAARDAAGARAHARRARRASARPAPTRSSCSTTRRGSARR